MRKLYLFLAILFFSLGATAQYSLSTTTYSQDFNGLGTATATVTGGDLNNLSPTLMGWFFSESGGSANTTITAGAGAGTSGDTYNFGVAAAADRTLGGLQSGSVIPTFGFYFTNNTGSTISSLTIGYTGETWRVGTASRIDRLDFQYSTSATSLTTGTWVDIDALDYQNPGQATGSGSIQHSASISYTITGLSIANGSTFFIRWNDFNASGADDGMGINNFSLTASSGATPPSVVSPTSSSITTNSATLQANVSADGGSAITARGFVWSTTNTDPTIGGAGVTNVVEGGTTTGVFTTNLSSLPSGTTVYFKGYATNASGTAYTGVASFTTFKPEPTNHVTSFACGTTTSSSIPLTWVDATGGIVPEGYLIKWSAVDYASIADPVDGTPVSNGSGALNVAAGVQTATIIGLLQNTTYYFKIYPYTNSGANINYKTDGTIPQTSCTTIAGQWEEFEVGTKTGYTTGDVTLASGSWNFDDALLGNGTTDRKNGTQSARIRNSGKITMNFDITSGVGYVRLYHGAFGTDAASTWHLEASTDGGTTWTAYVGPDVTTSSTTLTQQSFLVKTSLPVRLRIVKTDGTTARLNIDDISYTAFDPTLPIRFTNVKATQKGSNIQVDWTNATEENVVKYTVERSSNGRNFTEVGTVNARSNNNSRADYSFTDASPVSGDNFYRVKALENTGNTIYTNIVRINTAKKGTELVIYPNPVLSELSMQLSNLPAGNYVVRIINTSGQVISSRSYAHGGGSVTDALPVNNLGKGLYTLQVSGAVSLQKQFIKQ